MNNQIGWIFLVITFFPGLNIQAQSPIKRTIRGQQADCLACSRQEASAAKTNRNHFHVQSSSKRKPKAGLHYFGNRKHSEKYEKEIRKMKEFHEVTFVPGDRLPYQKKISSAFDMRNKNRSIR